MKQVLRERLSQQWSPEQIQGRLKLEGQRSVCTATIYAFIERDIADVHTITFDNGKEFAQHKQVANALKTACYFAHPYSS